MLTETSKKAFFEPDDLVDMGLFRDTGHVFRAIKNQTNVPPHVRLSKKNIRFPSEDFELSEAYTHFCQERGWKQETVGSFETQIKNVMLQLHRVSRRNDILRNAKSQRGFKHVALVDVGGY